jgi:hypothetical protein
MKEKQKRKEEEEKETKKNPTLLPNNTMQH